jgi:hypothetical protein
MNQDLNDVKVPKGATYKGQEVLRVLNSVVGESAKDSGYKVLLGDGRQEFISAANFAKLGEEEGDQE